MANVVAYLGPRASYTHQAAFSAFPDASYDLKPYTTIADVFAAVQTGEAQHGVVPFENSTYGPVVTTFDLLATALRAEDKKQDVGENEQQKSYSDIYACRDVFVQVQHCLLAHATSNTNSTSVLHDAAATSPNQLSTATATTKREVPSISHITLVQSHEQALGQCKIFLSTHLKHATKKEVSSTSRAAELAAADQSGATAAICSEMAADVYGLQVLRKGIQDRKDNVTRFIVLEKKVQSGQSGFMPEQRQLEQQSNGMRSVGKECKALVIFTVSHASPGALADSLAVFKKHGVNLTSINTRPSDLAPWNYYFFVEVTGRDDVGEQREGQDGQGKIVGALKDLEQAAERWRCLGGWTVEAT